MPTVARTLNNPAHRRELLDRLSRLDPEQPPLWGSLTAPQMLAHLCDQMRLPVGGQHCAPAPGPARYPLLRELLLYVLPWPKGKIQGPPEGFQTDPAEWVEDLATLNELVERFVNLEPERAWPDHPHFGRMNRRSWGAFCYKHFDHHLRQFGG